MKLAYYPGCSLSTTGIEYNMSTLAVARTLGLDLWEIPEWNCCGASSAHLTNHLLALALPARNLAIAEEAGLDVAVPCAACFARFKATEAAVKDSAETRATIEEVIGRKYEAKYTVKSLLDVFVNTVGLSQIKTLVNRPLEGLKVAPYYGCLLVRPHKITQFDDPEDPVTIDQIMSAIGAEPVYWGYKTECCGAAHPTVVPEVGLKMLKSIYQGARDAGADCIVTACPLCLTNLDMRQKEVGEQNNTQYNLPVFYFTELVGLALGHDPHTLGIDKHFVDALAFLKNKGFLNPVQNRRDSE
ncbi:MAG: CoB--CoM heterodisulfide reductase [Peptococcaceae bacterium]|nr:CoB--CoM heterodisulfide reductase [Peptococcaceae bacterium]